MLFTYLIFLLFLSLSRLCRGYLLFTINLVIDIKPSCTWADALFHLSLRPVYTCPQPKPYQHHATGLVIKYRKNAEKKLVAVSTYDKGSWDSMP